MSLQLVDDLSRAIGSDEIVPYFQPLLELRSGRLAGFEVLARWHHPDRGVILPDEFIPFAEGAGLIASLTEGMLLQAFSAAAEIPDHLGLSVNISPFQLRDHSLPAQIASAARRARFSPQRLTVEITESALIRNLELAREIADALKSMGVRLAIDDFGTGYSSLKHLKALPFDEIKVDGSFVRSMITSRESRKIAAAVVGLGQSLGLTTVAEGIEEKAQADMLFYLGCDIGQGWLYGKPVPPESIREAISGNAFLHLQELPTSPLSLNRAMSLDALPGHRLAQLQAIYDGVPVGLCFLDRNLRYVSINKRLAEMNGYSVDAHLGRHVSEILPDVFPILEAQMRRALRGEAVPGFEIDRTIVSKPEPERTVLISYHPARDEADEVVGVSVSVVDITELKRNERARLASEEHYRTAMDLNPQVPWTADPEGMILDAGPRWEELTGLSMEETLNEGWTKALHPEDLEATMTAWKESLRSGNPVDVEYRIRLRDGSWRWMRARGAAHRGLKGEIVRWYGTVEDIDQHRKVAEALQKSQARIEEMERELREARPKPRKPSRLSKQIRKLRPILSE